MICFPVAKINLGLNVVERRADGYHNLQTVFYPVPLCDALEVQVMDGRFPSAVDCDLKVTGIDVGGGEQQNLVVKAYNLLKRYFDSLPRVHAHLFKGIPAQAGMGGGSSDGAAMLKLLNDMFGLGLSVEQLIDYAVKLGADCPFFILGRAAYAEGIGERLKPIDLDLRGWWMAVVKPDTPVSTREAFSLIHPHRPESCCLDIIRQQPVGSWRDRLKNDFEQSVFALHPEIGDIKDRFYERGAAYAAMSGSGSAVYGLFDNEPNLSDCFPDLFVRVLRL